MRSTEEEISEKSASWASLEPRHLDLSFPSGKTGLEHWEGGVGGRCQQLRRSQTEGQDLEMR